MTTPTLLPPAVVRSTLVDAHDAAHRAYLAQLQILLRTDCCASCQRRNLEAANARLAEWEEAQRVLADWDAEAMRGEQIEMFRKLEDDAA